MTPLVRFTIFALVGTAGGYLSAQSIIADGISGLTLKKGPWTAWSEAGTTDSDPYTKAHFAVENILPLSKFEAITFHAKTDSSDGLFQPECDYKIEGVRMPARAWTLSLVGKDGQLLKNASQRYSFNSQNVVRRSDESFTVILSQAARPGNWIPMENVSGFKLQLDLFNTSGSARNDPSSIPVPIINKGTCR
jgi:hypothetical protein